MIDLQQNLFAICMTLGGLSISILVGYLVLYFFNLKNASSEVHDIEAFRIEAISGIATTYCGEPLDTVIDAINKVNDRILMPPSENKYLKYSAALLFLLSLTSLFGGLFSNTLANITGFEIMLGIALSLFLSTLFTFFIALLLLSLQVRYLKALARFSDKYNSSGSVSITIKCEK